MCYYLLSREWGCNWSSADRRCSNYIWVINNLIANWGASYIRDLTVSFICLYWCLSMGTQESLQKTAQKSYTRVQIVVINWSHSLHSSFQLFLYIHHILTNDITCFKIWTGHKNCNVKCELLMVAAVDQAPVPLTIFQSNLKLYQNLQPSGLKHALPITMKFCTRHNSYTVVMCAKFRCHRLSIC